LEKTDFQPVKPTAAQGGLKTMRIRAAVGAVVLTGCAAVTFAQTQTYKETTRTEVKPVIVTGEVVRYEPGRVIVIRSTDRNEVSYTLMPSLTVPSDVQVGRTVSLYTEPGEDGSTLVKRVTITSVTPSGNVKRTTEETRTSPTGETTTTSTTTVSGTVQAFEAGKSITITRPDGTQVTYMINDSSQLPAGIAIGRRVVIYPSTMTSGSEPMVQRVVYSTTKTKTKHGKTHTETKTKTETHQN
jgi:hypothetical protein